MRKGGKKGRFPRGNKGRNKVGYKGRGRREASSSQDQTRAEISDCPEGAGGAVGNGDSGDYPAEFDVVCSPSFCRPARQRRCR